MTDFTEEETPEKWPEDCDNCGYCLKCVRSYELAAYEYLNTAFDYENRWKLHVN